MVAKIKTTDDALTNLTSKLRGFARAPNINGYKPHDKQIEFHKSTAYGTIMLGGNRSGKTVAGAAESVKRLLGQHDYKYTPKPPIYGRSISVDIEQGIKKIVLPKLSQLIPPSALINGSWEDSYKLQEKTLYLANGSFIEMMTYDQNLQAFAGTPRHFNWYDEEPPEPVFTECSARLIDYNGQWFMTFTPVFGMTWIHSDIYEPVMEGLRTDVKIVQVNSRTDNPYISVEAFDQFMAGIKDEAERKARETGLFIPAAGFVYPMFDYSRHVLDTFVPPKDWIWACGMDHGITNPTAWVFAAIDKEDRIVIFDEYYESQRTVSENAQAILEKFRSYGRHPDLIVGDPAIRAKDPIKGSSVHAEYANNGLNIVLGNNEQKIGIDKVISYLGTNPKKPPMLYFTKNCVNLIKELKSLRWATYANKRIASDRNLKEEQHKRNDHACDALRYLISQRPELMRESPVENVLSVTGVEYSKAQTGVLMDTGLMREKILTSFDDYLGSDF